MRPRPGRGVPPRQCRPARLIHFHFACGVRAGPMTRASARLLGPCFKTGRTEGRLSRRRRSAPCAGAARQARPLARWHRAARGRPVARCVRLPGERPRPGGRARQSSAVRQAWARGPLSRGLAPPGRLAATRPVPAHGPGKCARGPAWPAGRPALRSGSRRPAWPRGLNSRADFADPSVFL